MAGSDEKLQDKLLKKIDEARDVNLRWQEVRRTQLGYVVNIVLIFSTASLAFSVKMIVDRPILPVRNLLFLSLGFLILAVFLGLSANLTRLLDFRYTANAARERWLALRQFATEADLPDEEELPTKENALKRRQFIDRANRLGRLTWYLLFAQLLFFFGGIVLFVSVIGQYNTSAVVSSGLSRRKDQRSSADCTPSNGNQTARRYDVIVVGGGIAGLSATRELQHLGRSVLILEANNRIGGRAYVGYIGDDKVPIDYGGAWIHGISTNPLTGMVDSMGFKRERTQLNLPYFINGEEASKEKKEAFDDAVKEYENAIELAASSVEDQHGLAKFACSEYKNLSPKQVSLKEICRDLGSRIPFSKSSFLRDCLRPVHSPEEFCAMADKDLRITSDVAEDYKPHAKEFSDDVIQLLIANAGPLESASELKNTSAVDGAHFEAGEDDLIDKGMGAFVEKLGDGLPVCLNSPVTEVDYSGDGVKVSAGGRVFEGSYALITVSVGVLKKKKIAFNPPLPEAKRQAIDLIQMGNMQKVIIPLKRDIFPKEPKNSWILHEGDLPREAVVFAKNQEPPLPLVNETQMVMALVVKPLNKNIAIGFFGGDWAKALEKRCFGVEHDSGKSNPKCDDLSIAITKSALSNISGEKNIDEDIQEGGIQITRWSLDPTSFGAYSVAGPGQWYQREKLAEPLAEKGKKRLFFAGEGTARAIYNGSYPGAYESGLKAARDIHATMLEEKE
jgi:monoamine oxidase